MMFSRSLFLATIVAAVFTTGCAGLSFQKYGTATQGYKVSEGATRGDVVLNLGEPSSIYKSNDSEVFVYKGYKGQSYFGILNKLRRDDTIVVMNQTGTVLSVVDLEVGKGWTIFGSPVFDATHPVPSSQLRRGPENFQANNESGF